MVKSIILGLGLALPILLNVPAAHARSANDYIRQQQAYDPGYNERSAETGRSVSSEAFRFRQYGYDYDGYRYPAVGCFLFTCLFGNGNSHKPRDGELRTLSDGTAVSYDKASNRWIVVHQPVTQPRGVYSDRDTYVAP
jgi:hypothetical protein